MGCLSSKFLGDEKEDTLVPTRGKCPGCKATIEWVSLVKELSLRTRALEEVEAIIKGKKSKISVSDPKEEGEEFAAIEDYGEKEAGSDDDRSDDGWVMEEDIGIPDDRYLSCPPEGRQFFQRDLPEWH
jgi:structure-specific endonuclease subunit SLX1